MTTDLNNRVKAQERDNSQLIAMFTGAALASVVTLAAAVLVVEISEIALYWAYAILGLLVLTSIGFFIYWWRRGEISKKLFGVSLRSLGEILKDASTDVENGDYHSLVVHRARELLATYTSIRIRTAIVGFTAVLFGELVLLINAAMLIQQTSAIKAQTAVADQQRIILERQTELLAQKDKNELFWQMYYDENVVTRGEHFAALIALGVRRFNGITLVRANLRGKSLDNLFIEGSDLAASFFDNANIAGSSFDDTDLTDCSFQNVVVDASFRNAILDGTSFRNADLSDAIFDGASMKRVDFTGANGLSVDLLVAANSLVGASGIPKAIMDNLEMVKPELF